MKKLESLLLEFVLDFERLYYQRMPERIHFVRQSIHLLLHLASEIVRLGPHAFRTQWPMERVIGYLGGEIHQPSNPYANLAQNGVKQCRLNALKAIFPHLDSSSDTPQGKTARVLSDGYTLLGARDRYARELPAIHGGDVIKMYLRSLERLNDMSDDQLLHQRIVRWSRLRLPTGQIARSAFQEVGRTSRKNSRISRMVKVSNPVAVDFSSELMSHLGSKPRSN